MSKEIVSIIIVAAGNEEYLEACLSSIKAQSYSDIEIIVIDNSLKADFGHKFSIRYPAIRLYSAPENLFYCAALNRGIKMSLGEYVLCLNDDVTLDKNFISEALEGFKVNKKIGMVSGKILRPKGNIIDSTGLFLSPYRTAKERGYGIKDIGQFEKAGYVFGVNGAAAFYRKAMLRQLRRGSEYFDSGFRFFYEDLDIAWRAQNLGFKGYYLPSALAYHIRGGTARKPAGINRRWARHYLSDELHLYLIKNRYRAIIKNESIFGFLFCLPFIFLYEMFMWGYILFFKPQIFRKITLKK